MHSIFQCLTQILVINYRQIAYMYFNYRYNITLINLIINLYDKFNVSKILLLSNKTILYLSFSKKFLTNVPSNITLPMLFRNK